MNASQFHTSGRKEVNKQAGPCWYCGRHVDAREGFGAKDRDVVWHHGCVGSELRRGRDKFYDTEGFFSSASHKIIHMTHGTIYGRKHPRCPISGTSTGRMNCDRPSFTAPPRSLDMASNRNPNAKLHESGKAPCHIIWCPGSNLPVTQTFDTAEEAWNVADELAQREDGTVFLVAQVIGASVVEKPVVRRTISNDAAKL